MGWQVALTELADADLGDVVAFLAKKSPEAAERIGLELVALIFSLDQVPNRGAPVQKRPGLRKIAHRHYLVIYRVNEAAALVEILRIWDNRPGPGAIARLVARKRARRTLGAVAGGSAIPPPCIAYFLHSVGLGCRLEMTGTLKRQRFVKPLQRSVRKGRNHLQCRTAV